MFNSSFILEGETISFNTYAMKVYGEIIGDDRINSIIEHIGSGESISSYENLVIAATAYNRAKNNLDRMTSLEAAEFIDKIGIEGMTEMVRKIFASNEIKTEPKTSNSSDQKKRMKRSK